NSNISGSATTTTDTTWYFGQVAGADGTIGQFNDGFKFTTVSNEDGQSTVTATVYHVGDDGVYDTGTGDDEALDKVTVSIKTIPNNSKLTYSLNSVSDLYAVIDSKLVA